jgi:nitrilase
MNKRIAAIQMTSGMNLDENLATAKRLLQQAADQGVQLAVLPEMFPLLGSGEEFNQSKKAICEKNGIGKIQEFLSNESRRLNLWVVAGTVPLMSSDSDKNYASCLVFNANGETVAQYNKIHLFDAALSKAESYRESDTTLPGEHIVVLDTPVGCIGLSVCYDIRFPELYCEMFRRGAQILLVPSAFTVPTGKAHWEVLLRARAIENFCYVVAPAQTGTHGHGRKTFGNSLIIAPTGDILAQLESGEGVITAEIDLELVANERQKIPVLEHRRIFKGIDCF